MPFPSLELQKNSVRSVLPWLEHTPLYALPGIDEEVRSTLALPAHQVWTSTGYYTQPLTQAWWLLWQPVLEKEPHVLYAMACAPSGQVRLRACLELARRPTRIGLGLLLVRSNDWVEGVRQTARSALQNFLSPVYASWWVEAVPLVLRFDQEVRAPFPELREQVRALLAAPDSGAAVMDGWTSPDIPVRRGLLQLLGAAGLPVEVQQLLAADTDHTIRRALVPFASPPVLRHLLNDAVASIRSAALALLLPYLDLNLQTPEIRSALLDPRSSVRWQVQYALRQAGTDVRHFYLTLHPQQLSTREKVGWLGGLYDVGQREDADQLRPFLSPDEPPPVRAEALRTLARLDAAESASLLWKALREAGQTARQAERSLVRNDLVKEQELQALWNEGDSQQRRTALRLTRDLPRYEAAALLLEWRPTEPRFQNQIDAALVKQLGCYGKTFFVKPSSAMLQRLLANQATGLPTPVRVILEKLAG